MFLGNYIRKIRKPVGRFDIKVNTKTISILIMPLRQWIRWWLRRCCHIFLKSFNPSSLVRSSNIYKAWISWCKGLAYALAWVMADELIMTAGAAESVNLAFTTVNGVSLISAIEHDRWINSKSAFGSEANSANENGRIDLNTVKNVNARRWIWLVLRWWIMSWAHSTNWRNSEIVKAIVCQER